MEQLFARSRHTRVARWLAALAALAFAACSHSDTPRAAHGAILLTLDTTRMDALGCYGGPSQLTPALDRLASEGVRFTNARSVAPLTLPAHASMLTGLYPLRHGLRDNGIAALPAAAETVAKRAHAAGVQTAAFVSAVVLDRAFGLAPGFDVYDQPALPRQQTDSHFVERPAADTVRAAREWLAHRDRARPFFLWVHCYDPHVPYAPPTAFLEQARGDAYRGEIASMDHALGELLETLRADGTLDECLVIAAADHGESLGEHGEPTHGAFCYDATLRIPLLVRLPDHARAGEVDARLASLVDVYPTLIDTLSLGDPGAIDGASLLAPLPQNRRGVYLESYSGYLNYGWSPLAGWVDAAGKYLHSSQPEFYDLATDPKELHDLAPKQQQAASEAQRAIGKLASLPALTGDVAASASSPELQRELRSLGYGASGPVHSAMPDPLAPSDRISPRAGAPELDPLLVANALGDQRHYEDSVPLLKKLVDHNPRHVLAMDLLAFHLMQLSRFEEAQAVLLKRLELPPRRADTLLNLATCRERLGQTDEARALFERVLQLDGENVQAREGVKRLNGTR